MADDTQTETAADSVAETTNTASAAAPAKDVEKPFFVVMAKPETGKYVDLETATTEANAQAQATPGTEFYVMEARRSALSPKPDVQDKELPQE